MSCLLSKHVDYRRNANTQAKHSPEENGEIGEIRSAERDRGFTKQFEDIPIKEKNKTEDCNQPYSEEALGGGIFFAIPTHEIQILRATSLSKGLLNKVMNDHERELFEIARCQQRFRIVT
tara:strand:- start:219 stop:578 length:360 start_codon:yes stop_codon:yes gene_type:complete